MMTEPTILTHQHLHILIWYSKICLWILAHLLLASCLDAPDSSSSDPIFNTETYTSRNDSDANAKWRQVEQQMNALQRSMSLQTKDALDPNTCTNQTTVDAFGGNFASCRKMMKDKIDEYFKEVGDICQSQTSFSKITLNTTALVAGAIGAIIDKTSVSSVLQKSFDKQNEAQSKQIENLNSQEAIRMDAELDCRSDAGREVIKTINESISQANDRSVTECVKIFSRLCSTKTSSSKEGDKEGSEGLGGS